MNAVSSGLAGSTARPSPVRPPPRRASPARALGTPAASALVLWLGDRLLPDAATLVGLGRTWLSPDSGIALPAFLVAGALLAAVGCPCQSIALVGGYLHGVVGGTVLAFVATLAGCLLAYQVAASSGADGLRAHLPKLAFRMDTWTRNRVFAKTVIIRLLPISSNLLTNLAAGASRTPRRPFLAGSLVGFLPQTIAFALTGTAVGDSSAMLLCTGAAMLAGSVGIALWLKCARPTGGGSAVRPVRESGSSTVVR